MIQRGNFQASLIPGPKCQLSDGCCAMFNELDGGSPPASVIGPQPISIHGAQVFVLPNPSGRNANFTYSEMLDAFVRLRRWTETSLDGPISCGPNSERS